jgi:hypothetical protein
MGFEETIRNAAFRLQKETVSIAEKVSDLLPKLGPGVGPRRDLIRLLARIQKQADRRINLLKRKVAGNHPTLRAMLKK